MGIESADWWQFFSHLVPLDIRYRFGRLVSAEVGRRLVSFSQPLRLRDFRRLCPAGLVGVANLAKDDIGQAETGLLVRSDWKPRGVGQALMRAALC
jgi:hypothetical protein